MKRLVSVLLVLGVSGCSSVNVQPFIPPVEESPIGEWALERADTQPLPFLLSRQGDDLTELVSATLDLGLTGVAQLERVTRIVEGGEERNETRVRAGTYQFNAAGGVQIQWDEGCPDALTYDPVTDELSGFDCELNLVMTWQRAP